MCRADAIAARQSFAGIGLGQASAAELAAKVMDKQQIRRRWMLCRALGMLPKTELGPPNPLLPDALLTP